MQYSEHERELRRAAKLRHHKKLFDNALTIICACGCGQSLKDHDEHGRTRIFINGHNGRIYKDQTQYKREWNHRNKKSRYIYKMDYYRKRKIKLIEMSGNCCSDCKVQYNGKNAAIFHYHHTDPSTKEFALGNQVINKSWNTIVLEWQKCLMLCANCHEMRHSVEF